MTWRKESPDYNIKTDLLRNLSLIMLECSCFTEMIAPDKPLTEGKMRQVMQNLYTYRRCLPLRDGVLDIPSKIRIIAVECEEGAHRRQHMNSIIVCKLCLW